MFKSVKSDIKFILNDERHIQKWLIITSDFICYKITPKHAIIETHIVIQIALVEEQTSFVSNQLAYCQLGEYFCFSYCFAGDVL